MPVTSIIIAANILVFILIHTNILNYKALGSSYDVTISNHQYYRIITCAFTQYTISHLLCNMLSLYQLGKNIETKFGSTKFAIIYAILVIACGITSLLIHKITGSTSILSIGASGVICGLLAIIIVESVKMHGFEALSSYLTSILILLYMTFDKRIDSIAHFTGFGYGIILAFILTFMR